MSRLFIKNLNEVIVLLIISAIVFSDCSYVIAKDQAEQATLSPHLTINISSFQNNFSSQLQKDDVIIIEKTPEELITDGYKQKITPQFFVELLKDWVECQSNLIGIGPAFFAYGSARFKPGHYWYEEAKKFGRMAAEHFISMITGGGPGIMLGANEGAYGVNGVKSVGLCMELPHEKDVDHFVYKNVVNIFTLFFTRKLMFILKSWGGATFPGGFGTLDEIFEILAFNKRYPEMARPNVMVGDAFYGGLMDFMYKVHFEGLMPLPEELKLEMRDSTEDAFAYLLKNAGSKDGLDLDLDVFAHDLFRASRVLDRMGPGVGIIGGTKTQRESIYWPMAQELASSLSNLKINVLRRGNKGTAEAMGSAYYDLDETHSQGRGLFIALHEDGKLGRQNSADVSLHFEYYFALKIALMEYSKFGLIVFPGGEDTLDVLFETLCLIKTNKIDPVPIVLVGEDFWDPLLDWVKAEMIPAGTINRDYLDLIQVVDSAEDAELIILEHLVDMKDEIDAKYAQEKKVNKVTEQLIKDILESKAFYVGKEKLDKMAATFKQIQQNRLLVGQAI